MPAKFIIDFFIFCMYSLYDYAGVVELVYALDSKSSLERGEGSSPSSGTKNPQKGILPESKAKLCARDENGLSVYERSSVCRQSGAQKKSMRRHGFFRGRDSLLRHIRTHLVE